MELQIFKSKLKLYKCYLGLVGLNNDGQNIKLIVNVI